MTKKEKTALAKSIQKALHKRLRSICRINYRNYCTAVRDNFVYIKGERLKTFRDHIKKNHPKKSKLLGQFQRMATQNYNKLVKDTKTGNKIDKKLAQKLFKSLSISVPKMRILLDQLLTDRSNTSSSRPGGDINYYFRNLENNVSSYARTIAPEIVSISVPELVEIVTSLSENFGISWNEGSHIFNVLFDDQYVQKRQATYDFICTFNMTTYAGYGTIPVRFHGGSHSHIGGSGEMCYGGGYTSAMAALDTGRLYDFFQISKQIIYTG